MTKDLGKGLGQKSATPKGPTGPGAISGTRRSARVGGGDAAGLPARPGRVSGR